MLWGGGSSGYWEKRYVSGDNSGNGSYNRLADFKARIVNEFIKEKNIKSVVEWGCGDGNQLSMFSVEEYLGLDVSDTIISQNIKRFKSDKSKRFMVTSLYNGEKYDMSLSLDVVYHLVEDKVFERYMNDLFSSSHRYVVIYSNNTDEDSLSVHIKNRIFTKWIDNNISGWRQIRVVKNEFPRTECSKEKRAETSFCDFYFYEKEPEYV